MIVYSSYDFDEISKLHGTVDRRPYQPIRTVLHVYRLAFLSKDRHAARRQLSKETTGDSELLEDPRSWPAPKPRTNSGTSRRELKARTA